MCVYCLLCMSSRRQSLSRRAVCAVCGVGVYFPSLFLYVCLCVYDLHAQGNRRDAKLTTHTEILQGEHVLFGVVKWKLDARLRYLMYV